MISLDTLRSFACSLPATDEAAHLDAVAFRVRKKIFVTVNEAAGRATVRLSPEDQYAFTACSQGALYPVPNKWGNHGWTHIDLTKTAWEICEDALRTAWWAVASPTLRAKHPELSGVEE